MAQATPSTSQPKSMDDIVALCRRRGFIFQSSEIYGGINGFWDYGPLGVELKNNVRDAWWSEMVQSPPIGPDGHPLQLVGLDSAIIQHPKVWEASGHLAGFSDLRSMCRQCKRFVRADHVWDLVFASDWYQSLQETFQRGGDPGIVGLDGEALLAWAKNKKKGPRLAPGMALVRNPEVTLSWIAEEVQNNPERQYEEREALRYLASEQLNQNGLQTPCPYCGGDLTEPRPFNLMFETYIGAVQDEDSKAYLRPETAQGIFANFLNVVNTSRVKVPFGIAQIGKAFRNEVTPRNFIFRSREFEQMEVEWFCHPDEAEQWYTYWRDSRYQWWQSIGLASDNLQLREHEKDELAHYAKEGAGTSDIEYRFPFTAPGFGELEGIAHRTDFDLRQHAEHSGLGNKLKYFDQERGEHYFPHVVEPAAGLTRGTLAILCEAYTPTPERKGSSVVMKFHPRLAPTKAAVFPLVNKDGMPEVAEKLYRELRPHYTVQTDAKQSIGKRYARMDEAGTPYCFTVDGQTLEDQTVTVRDRDTAEQQRIGIDKVRQFLAEKIGG